jgi:hypothetical protein
MEQRLEGPSARHRRERSLCVSLLGIQHALCENQCQKPPKLKASPATCLWAWWLKVLKVFVLLEWPGRELNPQHADFQSGLGGDLSALSCA